MSRLQSMNTLLKRSFLLYTKRVRPYPFCPLSSSSQHQPIDEEICPAYNPKHFYPAKPGEILRDHYQLLVKLGWGTRSTTWYRWQSDRYLAIKVLNSNQYEDANAELHIEKHIAQQNQAHRGAGIVRTCIDNFEVAGVERNHLCLAYEPMREPLWILQQRQIIGQNLPLPLAKAYLLILLAGLDYLHSECRVAHTDLKLDNILMTFGNDTTLPKFVKQQTNMPMEHKTDPTTGRTVYRCHNDLGELELSELRKMIPKIADFGSAMHLENRADGGKDRKPGGFYPIQADHYRAPEVIFGCVWDFSADIWNFGILSWNIIGRTDLFKQAQDTKGLYNAKGHLAEMISLLGPPPRELITRADYMASQKWPNPIIEAGKVYENGQQYFGGPFSDKEGNFLHGELIPNRKLEETISLEDDDKKAFLSFAREMLAWLPEKRKTAHELMEHPFLSSPVHN